jgi:hypothetical protein
MISFAQLIGTHVRAVLEEMNNRVQRAQADLSRTQL